MRDLSCLNFLSLQIIFIKMLFLISVSSVNNTIITVPCSNSVLIISRLVPTVKLMVGIVFLGKCAARLMYHSQNRSLY
jgi:hypothetical protein